MSFPIIIFLYLYYAFLVGWVILSLAGVYHMFKFGFKSFISFFTTFTYLVVSFIIILASFNYFSQVDWQTRISLFDGFLSDNQFMEKNINF